MEPTNPFPGSHNPAVVGDRGALIAAVPHLLGYHPNDSLVVLSLTTDVPATVDLILRVDLPNMTDAAQVAEGLTQIALRQRMSRVALLVVAPADEPDGGAGELPQADLVDVCRKGFERADIAVLARLWIGSTRQSGQWRCYDHPSCGGVMPDPSTTPFAAMCVADGAITYASRQDKAAILAPAPADVLARRAALLAAPLDTADGGDLGRDFALVAAAVESARCGALPDSDEELVELARALASKQVRDACLSFGNTEADQAAAALWQCLTRGIPSPHRAQPAALVAFAAYGRGDGVMATIALDVASAAQPDHELTGLLRDALMAGIRPQRICQIGVVVAERMRALLAAT